MRELQGILEQKSKSLIANMPEDYHDYVSLVRALIPKQAELDEDCVRLIAREVSQAYGPNMPLERISSFLRFVDAPIKHASLLCSEKSRENVWKILFGDSRDYSVGLECPESLREEFVGDIQEVHKAYQKKVGSPQNPLGGSIRVLQERVMPIDQ